MKHTSLKLQKCSLLIQNNMFGNSKLCKPASAVGIQSNPLSAKTLCKTQE